MSKGIADRRLESQLHNDEDLADLPQGPRTQQSHSKIFKPELGFINQTPTPNPKVARWEQASSPATCGGFRPNADSSCEPESQQTLALQSRGSQPPNLKGTFCFTGPSQISRGHTRINRH